jgi:hypothetical protein
MDLVASARRHEPDARALAAAIRADWHFDPVYGAVSAALDRDAIDAAALALQGHLPRVLDRAAAAGVVGPLRDVIAWAGGLERDQRLFVGAVDDGVALFATLWPWSESDSCTVRIGLFHDDARAADRRAFGALLTAWFGLSGSQT